MERSLQVRAEVKMLAWEEVRALWEMTGRLETQPSKFATARLERSGVQWLYSLLVLPTTTRVRLLPTVPGKQTNIRDRQEISSPHLELRGGRKPRL